jgi:hypothetical protein
MIAATDAARPVGHEFSGLGSEVQEDKEVPSHD